jgi:pyridinium-3,5-biscarboxylic acid mononucleotide synthase
VDKEKLEKLLSQVQRSEVTIEQALEKLSVLPYDDLGFARLDLHRELRTGLPEVIFCQSKTPAQVASIFERLAQHHARVLGTRATPEMAAAVQEIIPKAHFDSTSRLISLNSEKTRPLSEDAPYILVACAGTTDLPVSEEAAQTAEFLGSRVVRAYDVGVAGIHRLLGSIDLIRGAAVIISVAGMEGALTSVIGGLAACPVIGVPTSVGYGASFNGLAALLAMLNSCATGVAVVNIDNGFGAGVFAHKILQK